ncbi:MAG TPA: M23 family metallopeptidase [Candidatus Aminicenantes bacterium]|nr:M23 family metallopeptidase [Candidatus Aminicenantes bacterium]
MKACTCAALTIMIGLLAAGLSFQEEEKDFVLDDVVVLEYRDVAPGEVLKVSVKNLPVIQSAQVKFLNKKYDMAQVGDCLVCLIGLDLGIETGSHSLKVYVYKQDGSVEIKEQDIPVSPKQFPIKKLWVKEEFVTPPKNVMERIQREAELTKAVYNIYSPEWEAEGKFIVPVQGQIFPNFGERRFFNNKPRSQHSGVDIASPMGMPVKASNSGRVVLASHLYFAGNTVIIDHGLGVFSVYCHFSEITVKMGQKVEKGDIIGKIGSTGRVTGPHLHWSIRIRGSRVDPNALLSLEFE